MLNYDIHTVHFNIHFKNRPQLFLRIIFVNNNIREGLGIKNLHILKTFKRKKKEEKSLWMYLLIRYAKYSKRKIF